MYGYHGHVIIITKVTLDTKVIDNCLTARFNTVLSGINNVKKHSSRRYSRE